MTNEAAQFIEYVTAFAGGQMLGLPILGVQDVFPPDRISRVPLAPREVCGLMNLRGRIVTIVDLRLLLGFGDEERGAQPMVIGVERDGESYGLLVDQIGEVVRLDNRLTETVPVNLEPRLAAMCTGIQRLENELLLLLDLQKLFENGDVAAAA